MQSPKNLKKALRIIGIILFILVISKINWPEFYKIFKEINVFYFLLSVVLVIPALFIRTLKWKALVDSLGVKISYKTLTLIFAKGLFLGVITPGKLGEFYRAKYLAEKADISLKKSLYTVILDKLTDLLSMAFIGIPAIFTLMYLFEVKAMLMGIVLIFITALGIFLLIKKDYSQKLFKIFLKLFVFGSLKERAEAFSNEFFEGAKKLTKTLIAKLFYYEFISYLLTVVIYFLIALSLGLNIPFWYLCLIIPLVVIIIIIPVSVLGLGTREVGFIFFLSLINLNLNEAVAFSFLIMLWSIISALPGFILTYLPIKTSKPKQIVFILKLDSEEKLWKNLDKKVRNQTRKAKEYGLELKEGGDLLEEFYPLYLKVMEKKGSPPYGHQFFKDIIREFQDRARVFIVKYQGVPVAGMVALQFKDRVASLWAASDYSFNHMNPNDFLYWEVIKWAVKNNFKYFDFGRSPKGSGTYFFKKQWGGEEKPFSHDYYYSPSGKSLVPNITQSRMISKIWKLVPFFIAKRFGPIIRKYIK